MTRSSASASPSARNARLDDRAAVALRTQYSDLGYLWYSWHDDEDAARERVSAVLGQPVVGRVQHEIWDALLDIVRQLIDGRGASSTWLMDIENRGQLSRSLVDQLMRDCHGPSPAHIRSGWTQQTVLDQVTSSVRSLVSTGETDAAAALATSARSFLRRWIDLIPDEVPKRGLGEITPRQREAYEQAWRTAKADLSHQVRTLTVKSH